MASKPKSEQIVKDLAKLPSNKACFDCGRSGPQANVNLTTNTFVCTSCSGLLRNFNHKVKTINMYSFPQAEVEALEKGGNAKAKEYWLHRYTAGAFKLDPDDPKSVEAFMRVVYSEKRWCIDTPPPADPKAKKKTKSVGGAEGGAGGGGGHHEGKKKAPAAAAHKEADDGEGTPPAKEKKKASKARSDSTEGAPSPISLPIPTKKTAAAAPAPAAAAPAAVDLLGSFDSFDEPAAAAPAPSKSFESFDSGGFGGGGFGDDDGFGQSNGHKPQSATAAYGAAATGIVGGLPSIIAEAKSIVIPQAAVNSTVNHIRTVAAQYSLDADKTQALILQALGIIQHTPHNTAAHSIIPVTNSATAKRTGGGGGGGGGGALLDHFSDLPVDNPGGDDGNPFGSDDEDDTPAQGHHGHGGGGGGGVHHGHSGSIGGGMSAFQPPPFVAPTSTYGQPPPQPQYNPYAPQQFAPQQPQFAQPPSQYGAPYGQFQPPMPMNGQFAQPQPPYPPQQPQMMQPQPQAQPQPPKNDPFAAFNPLKF